jgi:hypothetical protein
VVNTRGEWKAVRVGVGPYLIGYVNAELVASQAVADVLSSAETAASTGVPERLLAESTRPLYRVPAGAQVRFDDKVIAKLEVEGWAREMNRYDTGEVDVFVAVNDDVAIRGMMRADDLTPAEETPREAPAEGGATTPEAPAPAPAPPAPAPAPAPEGALPPPPPPPPGG